MPILIVEDSKTQAQILEGLLRACGYSQIETAIDGFEALELLKIKRFEIIISDWEMPRVSGYQLLLVVRNDPTHGKTIFIMATSQSSEEAKEKARRARVSGYLIKPYNRLALETTIRSAFEEQSLREGTRRISSV